ncbi:MAG: type I CRISPR-associated protein Cas7, partial [archaeon]
MVNLKGRSELIFLYDTKDTNPNGDPFRDNAPRYDEETNQAMVSDVRIKRYVRDHIDNHISDEGND